MFTDVTFVNNKTTTSKHSYRPIPFKDCVRLATMLSDVATEK